METPQQDSTDGQLHNHNFTNIVEEIRERLRLQARERRLGTTDEQREQERLRAQQRRLLMTNEQREKERLRSRKRRLAMTEEQRDRERLRRRERRVTMTDEQREQDCTADNRTEEQIIHLRQQNRLYKRQLRQLRNENIQNMRLDTTENTDEMQSLRNNDHNSENHGQLPAELNQHVQSEAARVSGNLVPATCNINRGATEVRVIDQGSLPAVDSQTLDLNLDSNVNLELDGRSSEQTNASEGEEDNLQLPEQPSIPQKTNAFEDR